MSLFWQLISNRIRLQGREIINCVIRPVPSSPAVGNNVDYVEEIPEDTLVDNQPVAEIYPPASMCTNGGDSHTKKGGVEGAEVHSCSTKGRCEIDLLAKSFKDIQLQPTERDLLGRCPTTCDTSKALMSDSLNRCHTSFAHRLASDSLDEVDGCTVTDARPCVNYNLREECAPSVEALPVKLPQQIKSSGYACELFDILMIYEDKDFDLVYKLHSILDRFVQLAGPRKPSICMDLLDVGDPSSGGNKLDFLEMAVARSSCAFLFFSDVVEPQAPSPYSGLGEQGAGGVEGWTKYQRDKVLMDTILKKGISVVPLKMKTKSHVPDRFAMYRAIELSQLLRGKHLDEIEDVDKLVLANIDQRMIVNICRVLDMGRSQMLIRSQPRKYRMSVESRPAPVDASLNKISASEHLIQKHYQYLTETVDVTTGILDHLFSMRVFNMRELETVRTCRDSFKAMETLLDLLIRKSKTDLDLFITALRKTGQEHIAVVLEKTHL